MNIHNLRKKIFKKMCLIRFFELELQKYRQNNIVKILIYLSLGQEAIAASLSIALKKPFVFMQHRGHAQYLAFGGNPKKLVDEMLGRKTGTNKGMGGSPPVFDLKKRIFGHVGLIGDQVPVAVGYSLIKKKDIVVCFFGDGAAEEDYVLASLGYAATKKLNILFICDDNNYSVLTPIKDRRSWKIEDVAKSFGIKSISIKDDPITIYKTVEKFKNSLPALINIKTCREYWHEGHGKDEPASGSWNRFKIEEKKLYKIFGKEKILKDINHYRKWAKNLWEKQLQKQ
jgi:TPP-dependent pyruvate/acetoin dehydrogenase alpha subunit